MYETDHEPEPPDPPAEVEAEGRYLPVPASQRGAETRPSRSLARFEDAPLPVAAAAAAGGFVLGVVTWVLARALRRRRTQRSLGRVLSRRGGRGERVEVAASRSFLVDVHMLRR